VAAVSGRGYRGNSERTRGMTQRNRQTKKSRDGVAAFLLLTCRGM